MHGSLAGHRDMPPRGGLMSRDGYVCGLSFLGGMLMAGWCAAQPVTWNGRAGDDNWSTDFNWNDGAAPSNDGTADVVFAGSVRPRPYVDANWSVNSVGF